MHKYIPNSITLLNLFAGCLALYCAFHCTQTISGYPGYLVCFFCIAVAALADFCDGLSARLLGAYSKIGAQLDSLADLVSFGVAPAFLLFNLFEKAGGPEWLSLLCLLIPLAGALRLAKFNVDDTQSTTFSGLPIPGCAIFCIGLASMVPEGVNMWAAAGSVVFAALLMVLPVRMYSLKFSSLALRGNILRYLLVIVAVACIVIWGWSGLYYLIAYYVLTSFLSSFVVAKT